MTLIFDFPEQAVVDKADEGYCCSKCGSFIKRYRRKINSNMAYTLLLLYKAKKFDWLHVEKWLLENKHPRSGDFHKLVLFGLLDKMEGEREDGSPRNGYYKLNGKSLLFCENKLTVPEKAVILNGKLEKFEGKQVGIVWALGSKFSYFELISK